MVFLQWKPLNGITLVQIQTKVTGNNNKQMSINKVRWEWKSNLGLVILDKFDPIKRLIPLNGTHCFYGIQRTSLKFFQTNFRNNLDYKVERN
jgi:hypothetical protein